MANGGLLSPAARALDVARRALVTASRKKPQFAPRPDGEPLRFIFTIDTEISMGGAARDISLLPVGARKRIWGDTKSGAYGIDCFMDIFDEHGMKGVFFYEPVGRHVVSEEELEEAARHIADRGHDVELHIHPEFEMDLPRVQRKEAVSPPAALFEHSLDEQRRYIREGLDTLERWTGRRPMAFRAGGYTASELTLAALRAEGIYVDSSYNHWAIGAGLCGFKSSPELNDVAMLDDVLEVPVTNLTTRGPRSGLRPLELSSLNATEMIAALDQLYEAGTRVACGVTHSFRLVRTKDFQYNDVSADVFNIHRMRVLCRHLAAHPHRFRVCTYRELPLERWKRTLPAAPSHPYYPEPPMWSSVSRLALQAIKDRGVV